MDPLQDSTAVVSLADHEEKGTETETANQKGETKDGGDNGLDIEEKARNDATSAEDAEVNLVRDEDGGETATSNPEDVNSPQTKETKVDDSTETDPQQPETEKVPQEPTEVDEHEVKFAISQDSKEPEEDENVADDLSLKEEGANTEPRTGDGVPSEPRAGER